MWEVLCVLLGIYNIILIARVLMSWFPRPPDALRPVYQVVFTLTEPPLRLVRPLVPPLRMGMMALDVSAIIVFVVVYILRVVTCGAAV